MSKKTSVQGGLVVRSGSILSRWLKRNAKNLTGEAAKEEKARKKHAAGRRGQVVRVAHSLVGITETPYGSNSGPGVRMIQSATGAYGAAWCVSTVQYIWKHALGSTWADGTAGAYYLADYAARHGAVIPRPIVGCAVVYHIGQGHAGTVVAVGRFGTFTAVEGNENNAVNVMQRSTRQLRCTFILRPELR